MATEVTITAVKVKTTKADGSPMLTKTGKPMWGTSIQIAERPGVWIGGLCFSDPTGWVGTKKALILSTEDYNGKPQPKFKVPSNFKGGGGIAPEKIEEMIGLLREIRDAVRARNDS